MLTIRVGVGRDIHIWLRHLNLRLEEASGTQEYSTENVSFKMSAAPKGSFGTSSQGKQRSKEQSQGKIKNTFFANPSTVLPCWTCCVGLFQVGHEP